MRIPHACIFLYRKKSHDNWTFMKSILPYSTFPLCPENTNNNTHYSYEGKLRPHISFYNLHLNVHLIIVVSKMSLYNIVNQILVDPVSCPLFFVCSFVLCCLFKIYWSSWVSILIRLDESCVQVKLDCNQFFCT